MPGVWRASPSSSAGRSSALVGMQAQNGHSPPTSSCSTIAVESPALTRRLAAPRPPGPAPKTTASNCFFLVIVGAYLPVRDGWESSCRACRRGPADRRSARMPPSPHPRLRLPVVALGAALLLLCAIALLLRADSGHGQGGNRILPPPPAAAAAAPARGSCLVPAHAAQRFQSTTHRRVVALTFDDGPGAVTASV